MKRILFISNVPSPYQVEYLNELGKLAQVHAVFERGASSERDKSWKDLNVKTFTCSILRGINIGANTAFCPGVTKYIKKRDYDYLIFGNPLTPTGILQILYCKAHKIPFILQSEGGLAKNGKGPKERFKKFIMKDAQLYLSGMRKNEYFLTYGATPDTVWSYPFASLYQKDIRTAAPSQEEKQVLRKELGMKEEQVLLYVGRFIPVKGVDVLIKACVELGENTGIYLVGGEAPPEYLDLVAQYGVQNVHFVSHIGLHELKKYYLAADLFVLPTRSDTWGLVINEAMSCGLPVITTTRCVAGLDLIEEGKNGYLVPVEDAELLHRRIAELLDAPSLVAEMASNNIRLIQDYSYEKMAARIFSGLQSIDN